MPLTSTSPNYLYPVLIVSIAEARAPNRCELKQMASRIKSESFPQKLTTDLSKFQLNRLVWRAARLALLGSKIYGQMGKRVAHE